MIKMLITNLLKMLIGKKMVIWGLKFAARQTDNKIDDNVVLIAEAAYNSDPEQLKKGLEGLTKAIKGD